MRAKWDAWHKVFGMSKAEAMQGYIDEIEAQKFKVVIDNRGGTATVRLFKK